MSGEGSSRRYEIIEALKTGGSAEVFLGLMRGENGFVREVVIKKPRAHLAVDARFRAMFVDEAHLASRLSHPNIVQVIDLVANANEVYLVLEYLSGRDLRELLRRCFDAGQLPPLDVALYIAAETAAGLDYAHRATAADGSPLNIVHRDVSPKNIRLTDEGAVKVIDFGIAHAEQRITETAPGSVKGTPGYMAPEQALGEPLDRRSDVFSLGICLFQMLTGRNPFDAPELRDRMQLLLKAPTPLAGSFRSGLPPALEEIVGRSLARDPLERFTSAGEMGRALEQVLHGLGTASPRARLVEVLEQMFPDLRAERGARRVPISSTATDGPSLPGWADTNTAALANTFVPDTELRPSSRPPPPTGPATAMTTPMPPPASRSSPLLYVGLAFLVGAIGLITAVMNGREVATPRFDPIPLASTSNVRTPTTTATASSPVVADAGTKPERVVTKSRPGSGPKRSSDEPRAEALFAAASHLTQRGHHEDARFLYELILATGGRRPKAAVLKNLALTHRALGDVDRMQACFRDYLETRPDSPDAHRIQQMLEAGNAPEGLLCLSKEDAALVRLRAERVGSRIEAWIADAGK